MAKLDCVVIGDVMYDFTIKVKSVDTISRGGVNYSRESAYCLGGAGNVATLLSYLKCKCCFIGKAGEDVPEQLYEEDLNRAGIHSYIFKDKQLPTGGVVSIVESNGERSFLVNRGANDNLTVDEIDSILTNLSDFQYCYLSGYSLARSPQSDAIIYAASKSKKAGAKVIFDAGAFNLIKRRKKYFQALLKFTDVLCANELEIMALAGTDKVYDAARLISKYIPLVITKLGKKGSLVVQNQSIINVPAYRAKAKDTTGAGDAFTSGIIFGLAKDFPIIEACRFGNWIASKNVEVMGARVFPSMPEIQEFINSLSDGNEIFLFN